MSFNAIVTESSKTALMAPNFKLTGLPSRIKGCSWCQCRQIRSVKPLNRKIRRAPSLWDEICLGQRVSFTVVPLMLRRCRIKFERETPECRMRCNTKNSFLIWGSIPLRVVNGASLLFVWAPLIPCMKGLSYQFPHSPVVRFASLYCGNASVSAFMHLSTIFHPNLNPYLAGENRKGGQDCSPFFIHLSNRGYPS